LEKNKTMTRLPANTIHIMKKHIITTILFFGFASASIFAQQGIHSSGGNASGAGGSVSYSVGQVFYSSQSGSNGALIQGVQQPFELIVTEVKEMSSSILKCEAYPNPAVKELNLRISGEQPKDGSWKLIDARGVSILNGSINTAETLIPMNAVPMAAYTLQVFSGKKEIKSFKIIKQ
jgi:hypothetical protein